MRGRKPRLTPPRSKGQYTTTIEKQFYRLGTDKAAAEERFRFLLNKHEMGEAVDDNPRYSVIVDKWLVYVEKNDDPERHRLCHDRLSEFTHFVGLTTRVRDLRPRHVEEWLQSKKDVKKAGTKRNYTVIILACLNWAANKKKGNLIAANPLRGRLELPEW